MAAWPPANPALAGKIPPSPPFCKGGLGGFEGYFLTENGRHKVEFFSDIIHGSAVWQVECEGTVIVLSYVVKEIF